MWAHGINNVLDGDQGRTNPFAAAMDQKTVMRPFVKILYTCFLTGITLYSHMTCLTHW